MGFFEKITFAGCLALLLGCAQGSLSDRDAKLEQARLQADQKRRELLVVAGDYAGLLKKSDGTEQRITLKLGVKDIPTPVEGSVDPVMMPTLAGYLRFVLDPTGTTYIGFSIDKGSFDVQRNKLDLVLSNPNYKEVIVALDRAEPSLIGSWTAPSIAESGTIALKRGAGDTTQPTAQLQGEYGGYLYRGGDHYQFGHFTLTTSVVPPDGLKVSAVVRVIFGDWLSTEYLTYKFDIVEYNPVTGQIIMRNAEADVTFSGYWSNGVITGDWSSKYTGRLGEMNVKKDNAPAILPAKILMDSLKGTYRGPLENVHPGSNLPERIQLTFVTSQDLSSPSGIKVTGNVRFYLGEFDSLEFVEVELSEIQHNFFTRKLVAKSDGEVKFTLKADVEDATLKGPLFSDGMGEVAKIEVKKQ